MNEYVLTFVATREEVEEVQAWIINNKVHDPVKFGEAFQELADPMVCVMLAREYCRRFTNGRTV